uniref:Uncharacterized protein n=1 Tax=Cannabis sativa TaxID=3483 RepID=A0A803NS78_CANSA
MPCCLKLRHGREMGNLCFVLKIFKRQYELATVMACCSNLKRTIPMSNETEPLIRQVVQVIPATYVASKKKVGKRGRC